MLKNAQKPRTEDQTSSSEEAKNNCPRRQDIAEATIDPTRDIDAAPGEVDQNNQFKYGRGTKWHLGTLLVVRRTEGMKVKVEEARSW